MNLPKDAYVIRDFVLFAEWLAADGRHLTTPADAHRAVIDYVDHVEQRRLGESRAIAVRIINEMRP